MINEVSDADLLAAHVNGDPHAFGELFGRHRDRLWAVALRTAGGPDDAADALQDAMVSAFRRAGSFRGEAAVTTWLHRIVVNACLDQHRRRRNKPTTTWIETLHETAHTVDDMSNRELQIELEKALAELPDDQRAAIVLVDVEGYGVDDAAAILGCPPGTVKSRCARGRAKLAKQLTTIRNPDADPGVLPKNLGGAGHD
ncbi:MAG: RNA polymerase sigma factor SigM [Actinobacteria bacterium]|nr:RNA polymerase sigma factor SigM [Actinomycetota bacterium]MCB8997025.1 RNA polymerase sigma factor SigM [Actinomycetota bacterium]MCB9413984.1 RNA polymerase sigma factor SigM [Actinomycetota bacterium]